MTTTELLNALPVTTWNHLRVNGAPKEAALPEKPEAGWGETNTIYELSDGVRCTAILPQECTGEHSGLGKDADLRIHTEANFSRFFLAEGISDGITYLREKLDAQHPNAVTHTAIHAKAGSKVTFVQILQSDPEVEGLSASLTQIAAEPGADVTLVQLQLLNEKSKRYNGVSVKAAKDAHVKIVRAELGGNIVVTGARAMLGKTGGEFDIDAIYYGDGDSILDFNDVAVHTGRETHSEMHNAGVLADRCRKTLRGTIDFRRGAVHAVGHESEDVLLFSPEVRHRSAPLILCTEENVEGQHAASAGRLDENVLYYLASRGLDPQQATRLMVDARFAPVVDKIPDEALRDLVRESLERRLEHAQILG